MQFCTYHDIVSLKENSDFVFGDLLVNKFNFYGPMFHDNLQKTLKINVEVVGRDNIINIHTGTLKSLSDSKINIKIIGNNNKITIGDSILYSNSHITLLIYSTGSVKSSELSSIFIGDLNCFYGITEFHCVQSRSHISVGNNNRLYDRISFFTTDFHTIYDINDFKILNLCGNINVGNNNIIGSNCTVSKNTSIGNYCMLLNDSLVIKDIISMYTIYEGNPARAKCSISQKLYNDFLEDSTGNLFEHFRL